MKTSINLISVTLKDYPVIQNMARFYAYDMSCDCGRELKSDWVLIGEKLINESKKLAKKKGAVQIIVVCGVHDMAKNNFLNSIDLTVASNWYVGKME